MGPASTMENESECLKRLRDVCHTQGIDTNGVVAITIQRNYTSQFASFIVNFATDNPTLASHYPAEFTTVYTEGRVGPFLYAYQEKLDATILPACVDHDAARPFGSTPFCCHRIAPYRNRRTSMDREHRSFLASEGSTPRLVYSVKEQVDHGPMISTRHFTLTDGVIDEVRGTFTEKQHAYKNYKCTTHNRFFGLDLFTADGSVSHNSHHMRVNAFTHPNEKVLRDFLELAEGSTVDAQQQMASLGVHG